MLRAGHNVDVEDRSGCSPGGAPGRPRVTSLLVVEADPECVLLLAASLPDTVHLQHAPDLTHLQQAVENGSIAEHRPDVMILDLAMPEAGGIAAYHRASEIVGEEIGIVVVTGMDGLALAQDAIAAGAQDFVSKRDLRSMPWARMERILTYARERHGLRRALDDANAERAMREELFRSVADRTNSMIFRCRLVPDTQVEFLNAATEVVTGLRAADLVADPAIFLGRVHDEDRSRVEVMFSGAPEAVDGQSFRFLHRSGDWRHLEPSASAIRDGSGRIVGVQGVIRDVTTEATARAELEEALVEQQRQVESAKAQKLEAIGRLAAGMAHELNTPIQFVSDNVRFVRESVEEMLTALLALNADEALDDKHREAIEVLELDFLGEELGDALRETVDGLERMGRLVGAIKEFAHPGDGGRAPTDLNRLVRNTVTVSRNEWKYVATVDVELEEDLPLVPLESDQMSQVMLNLIVNASQAIAEQSDRQGLGKIVIRTRQDAETGAVVITIVDDGPGIPDEIAEQIWDPFFTTKGVGVGSGQGLAIARVMVEDRHDGRIELAKSSEGTRFDIHLPVEVPESEQAAAA